MTAMNNFRIFEAIAHESAMDTAARRELTPAQRRESRRLLAYTHERLAELRHSQAEREKTSGALATTIRPSILAMARDAIVNRLGELLAAHPRAVFAHRDFTSMSDDDLRSALEDAEFMTEQER